MADVWETKDWADRHFAEGLGLWEVNVYKALRHFHPDHQTLAHPKFRRMLAHAMLTLGKATFGEPPPQNAAQAPVEVCQPCKLEKFDAYADDGKKNVGHQCGYCKTGTKGYYFCITCFPNGKPTHAICNPATGRECFAQHMLKEPIKHFLRNIGPKRGRTDDEPQSGPRTSPRRAGPRAQRANARDTQRSASAPARSAHARRSL